MGHPAIKSGIGNPQGNLEEYARQAAIDGHPELAGVLMLLADQISKIADSVTAITRMTLEEHTGAVANAERFDPATRISEPAMTVKGEKGELQYAVKGFVPDRRITYGVVYPVGLVDLQGEWATAEVVEKAAHDYLREYRMADTEHNWQEGAGVPVESFIAPCQLTKYFGQDLEEPIEEGSWVVAMEWTPDNWGKVVKGDISGYSLGGLKRLGEHIAPPERR